ncbi:MAG: gamma-glutamyltransferase family protein [Fretibacterium sp.]|nr:gamma-glutamyltransferase family protein [Fretibacterium sp.]
MNFNAQRYRYPSRRTVVFASRGAVATGHPLAAQVGLEILKKGGNAVDAAVATAACLTVVEPTSNGIGGDAFALVWSEGKLHGLNASGWSPAAVDASALHKAGHREVPVYGWYPVTVPGAPAGWVALSRRFGRLPMEELLAPAINYASEGHAVAPTVSRSWARALAKYSRKCRGEEFQHWFEAFCPEGRAPRPGEIWRFPDQARTLSAIAESGAEAFYRGELAERIGAFSERWGGWLRASDLADYKPEWVEPLSVNYRGFDVWEIPPNGHGIAVLMALKILEGLKLPTGREEEESWHLQIEAMKLAFCDVKRCVGDPRFMEHSASDLLSDSYAAERRALIDSQALEPLPGMPQRGGTVYLAVADGEGGMVSMIQSNYMGFGSGLVVPGTGIALHNRGNNFSLNPDSPNFLAPLKKPYHTIIPGFLSKEGEPVGPFGVMGGFMQPQGHLQVVSNLVDFGMNPQEALDAPRWQWTEGKTVQVEQRTAPHIVAALTDRGHEIVLSHDTASFGRGEMILRTDDGTLAAATEPRTDGCVAAW